MIKKILKNISIIAAVIYEFKGCKNKFLIDKVAVELYKKLFNSEMSFSMTAKISEGESENLPTFKYNEVLGNKNSKINFDFIIDPIENTTGVSQNNDSGISCFSLLPKNLIKYTLPELYMQKFFGSKEINKFFDLNDTFEENIKKITNNIKHKKLTCIILDRKRHQKYIKVLKKYNINVLLIKNGDVIGAIDILNKKADFLFGIGGSAEGYLKAALALSSNFSFKFKLISIKEILKNNDILKVKDLDEYQKKEKEYLKKKQLIFNKTYNDKDLFNDYEKTKNNIIFFTSTILNCFSLKKVKKGLFFYKVHCFYSLKNKVYNKKIYIPKTIVKKIFYFYKKNI